METEKVVFKKPAPDEPNAYVVKRMEAEAKKDKK